MGLGAICRSGVLRFALTLCFCAVAFAFSEQALGRDLQIQDPELLKRVKTANSFQSSGVLDGSDPRRPDHRRFVTQDIVCSPEPECNDHIPRSDLLNEINKHVNQSFISQGSAPLKKLDCIKTDTCNFKDLNGSCTFSAIGQKELISSAHCFDLTKERPRVLPTPYDLRFSSCMVTEVCKFSAFRGHSPLSEKHDFSAHDIALIRVKDTGNNGICNFPDHLTVADGRKLIKTQKLSFQGFLPIVAKREKKFGVIPEKSSPFTVFGTMGKVEMSDHEAVLCHGNNTTGGSSGSPLLSKDKRQIACVHSNGRENSTACFAKKMNACALIDAKAKVVIDNWVNGMIDTKLLSCKTY